MLTKRNFVLILFVVAVLAVGAFAVFAQDDTGTTTPPFGMMGRGGMHGMMAQDYNEHPMFVAVAGALGLTPEEFAAALQEGKTVADLATEKEVDLQTVYDAALATATAHIASQVEAGTLTQEEADAHLAWMQENIAQMPIFNGGGMGMMGGGMMGRGMMGRGMMGSMNPDCPMADEAGTFGHRGMRGMGRWGGADS